MIKKLILFLFFFLITSFAQAATYNAYFSDDATGNAVGTDTPVALSDCSGGDAANTCKTLAHVQSYIDLAGSADTVNIYLDKSDTWTIDSYDPDNYPTILVGATDPTVTIQAYGSGADPIIDGSINWASPASYPYDPPTNSPYMYSTFIQVKNDNFTMDGISIKNIYGVVFRMYGTDSTTVTNCTFNDIGWAVIAMDTASGNLTNYEISKNYFSGQMMLHKYATETGFTGDYSSAISLFYNETSTGNVIKENVFEEGYSEYINANGVIVEKNLMWSNWNSCVLVSPGEGNYDGAATIVRYNVCLGSTSSDWNKTSDDGRYWSGTGIGVQDENSSGSNTNWDVEIYGNIIINRYDGFRIYENAMTAVDPINSLKIYNNVIIDCKRNWYIGSVDNFTNVTIYNNLSALFDRSDDSCTGTGSCHVYDVASEIDAEFDIDTNAFWSEGGGLTVDADFQTNYITTNPLLEGEEKGSPVNWDSITLVSDVGFADILPGNGSSLIEAAKALGAGYEDEFLGRGTSWNVDPSSSTWVLDTQKTSGDLGAALQGDIIIGLNGFGTDTRAAYGAANDPEICVVDDLTDNTGNPTWDSGTYTVGVFRGSLLQCIEGLDTRNGETIDGHTVVANSGKIILFETSGTIHHTGVNESTEYFYSIDGYTSIYGQSAPSPGILLRNITLVGAGATAHDILVQHIRGRMGSPPTATLGNHKPFYFGTNNSSDVTYNIVLDHISGAYGNDVQLGLFTAANSTMYDITVANSIFTDGVVDADIPGTLDQRGVLIGASSSTGDCSNVLFYGNLVSNMTYRHPATQHCNGVVIANNAIYNSDGYAYTAMGGVDALIMSLVGNVLEGGPASGGSGSTDLFATAAWTEWHTPLSDHSVYAIDNKSDAGTQSSSSDWTNFQTPEACSCSDTTDWKVTGEDPPNDAPVWPVGFTAMSSTVVKQYIIDNAGAYPAFRDSIDQSSIDEFEDGTTGISSLYTDHPEIWPSLAVNSSSWSIPANPHSDDDSDGYTNLEEWMHNYASLVEAENAPTLQSATLE